MAEFSLDEAYGKAQEGHAFGLDEAYGPKKKLTIVDPPQESNAALAVKGTLGTIAGAAGAVMDMFTDILGGVTRTPSYIGARVATAGSQPRDALLPDPGGMPQEGVRSPFGNQKLSAQAAAIAAENVLPEAITTPFAKIAKSLGPEAERYYKENPVSWINEKVGEYLQSGTVKGEKGTGVPAEDIMQGLDAIMTAGGVAGTRYAVLKAIKDRDAVKAATAAKRVRLEREAARAREEARVAASVRPDQSIPAQQQINSLLRIKTADQRAAEARQKRADVKAAFKRPAEDSDFIDLDESIFRAEERMRQGLPPEQPGGQTAAPNTRPFLPEVDLSEGAKFREAARILQTPGFNRTAADLATLRRIREAGGASPELIGLLATAGLGATIGGALDEDALRGAGFGAATGAAAALPFVGRGAAVRQRMGQTGAVKGPGGNWIQNAERPMASLLKDTLISSEEAAASKGGSPHPKDLWADKAVKNYLNRYAGTANDPLKDLEIPFGEESARWESLTDKLIDAKPYLIETPNGKKVEQQYAFGRQYVEAGPAAPKAERAILSYMQHVGDYLRQNVPADKLPQYDLVRAVKETAVNDVRVAKEMAKARSASTAQLPVYKEYPDGYKWVELKLPEKLTEEQAKGIKTPEVKDVWESLSKRQREEYAKKYGQPSEKDLNQLISFAEEVTFGEGPFNMDGLYMAVDTKGNPIKNSYTGKVASGMTPEQAFLAGRLAEEGNTMGHCVGGYCEGVAAGESKIYSLRGPEGESHVTVEVEPYTQGAAALLPITQDTPLGISQIKGKQNRAPNEKYLPYVHDFVKSGQWEDVRDFQNTGLFKTPAGEFLTPAEVGQRFGATAEEVARYKEGKLPLNSHAYINISEGLGRRPKGSVTRDQLGQVDPQLLTGLGKIGLASAAGSFLTDEPWEGALLGALAGIALQIPGSGKAGKDLVKGLDYLAGNISTRLGNIAPELKFAVRRFDEQELTRSYDLLKRTVPWMKALNDMPKAFREEYARAVLTNDAAAITELQKGNRELVAGWREVRNVLTQLGTELGGYGRFKTMREDYFPRLVKDLEGLKGALDQPIRTKLEAALAAAEAKAIKSRGTPLTDIETSAIINKELSFSKRAQGYQPGYAKSRGVEEITEKLQPFYYTPEESLFAYVRGAVTDAETARFFGKDLVQTEAGNGGKYTNVDQSIGNYVGRLMKDGKLTAEKQREVEDLLKSRFKAGERSPNALIQDARNLINAGLLGNAVSAATQLGDVAMPIYAQGLRATTTAAARLALGKGKISAREFGLAEHMVEEFTGGGPSATTKQAVITAAKAGAVAAVANEVFSGDNTPEVGAAVAAAAFIARRYGTAAALNKIFKYSGFSMVDRFGKNMMLNAAHAKLERLSRTPEGQKQLADKYGKLFVNDMPQLVQDLRSGQMTERVRAALFNELADYQPISKSEVPQGYLDAPNGRIAYMLKTFMLKQFDIVRRDTYNEIKSGDPKRVARGLKNLTGYAATLGIAGATAEIVKDWLMGREISFDQNDLAENVLKTFGWSEYVRDKAKNDPVKAYTGGLAPPVQIMDDIITGDPRAVQYIPIIGKLYYNWELGGREDAEIRQWQKARKEGHDIELSSRAEDRREAKREKARERNEK